MQELNLLLPQRGLSAKSNHSKEENKKEFLILQTLKEEALHIDKIIEKTKLSAVEVTSILAVLEINNKVRNLGGNIYALMR